MAAERFFLDLETVGPRREDIQARLRDEIVENGPPARVTLDGWVGRALEASGYLDHYAAMKAGKRREWLEDMWGRPPLLDALVTSKVRDAALDTMLAEIIIASVVIDEQPVVAVFSVAEDRAWNERAVLENFRQVVDGVSGPETVFIGHNILRYDLPLLWSRFRVHGVEPPAWLPRWKRGRIVGPVYDTMQECSSNQPYVSAERAALAYGLGMFKTVEWRGAPMDGSRVADAVEAGEWGALYEYARADVLGVRELARRMTWDWRRLQR